MRQSFKRAASLATAAALPIVFMAATPVVNGVTYEFVMKSTSKATGNKETVTLRGRGAYGGNDGRIEIVEASSSTGGQETFGGQGTYFIVKNGGEEMLLVNPSERQYMKWDVANMFAAMGKVVNAVGGLVKMQMSDVKIEAQDMGAGPTIEGYPTKHIRMTQNYTMSASVFGRTSKTKNESTIDYYFAPTLRVANPFVSNSQTMAMMSQLDVFNNPEYKSQMAAANAKLPKSGIPVRTVTTIVTTDDKGKQETATSIMEMVKISAGNILDSQFQIPPGYTKVEMADLAAAQPPADSAGSAKKPTAADAAKSKLRGILKK